MRSALTPPTDRPLRGGAGGDDPLLGLEVWRRGNAPSLQWFGKSKGIQKAIAPSASELLTIILAIALALLLIFSHPNSAQAAIAQPARLPLTLELLQQRIANPTPADGVRSIDLRRFIIDLRSENAAFRDSFYRLLQIQLRRSNTPTGIDLSYSQILGELKFSDFGFPEPLYGQPTPLLSEGEQTQLQRDRLRLLQLSQLSRSLLARQPAPQQITVFRGPLKLVQTRFEGIANFSNTFFLARVEAQGADFDQTAAIESRFGQTASFAGAVWRQDAQFRSAIFFDRASFNQAQFQGSTTFQSSEFQKTANFSQASFHHANFSRIQWQGNADFAQTRWQAAVSFDRSRFQQSVFFSDAVWSDRVTFYESQFSQPVNLRGASILDRADFGDASFGKSAYLNVAGLQFSADRARILGNPGIVGRVLSVPTLRGNETLLRNLVRNFRLQEQITDANQIEYTTERLRLQELKQRLLGTNLNTASIEQLRRIGFSPDQAAAILAARSPQPLRNLTDLLKLSGIDLATYVRVRDRVVVTQARSIPSWLLDAVHWLGLNLLLLLSQYGTNFWLIFGVGLVAIAYFGLVFWLVDRCRRRIPQPILPNFSETVWMLSGFSFLTLSGLAAIVRTSQRPGWTIACLALVLLPVPIALLTVIYGRGRYHDLMNVSYFEEEGTLRQLRIVIGRLPILPRYEMFRERYLPILWERRWNWLNYFDFSLNNLLKIGFNDIRLRDRALPGAIATLAWYQWSLGLLYIALLLWTLSRTIPGLNLLIYFK
ncbi:pentapeptide repeat-containing protein [Microcoleus sp. FACHB-1515]|uniref:pentapeptide repeat-containing protein n=1 Tax=Cyanophyceae TaxID=3028117 RepID=UPI0016879417|nr:pentapeptide repeat-containing protein [Microcoleus sp. FACHB-1515]MBD2089456.1 pentapeptide repeat-containing protein [Microcoleus sp. FACHB-1515]